jgi:hypothetical protein
MRKTVLSLEHLQAKKFFLEEESYTTLELPPYYTFKQVLSLLADETLDEKSVKKCKCQSYTFYKNLPKSVKCVAPTLMNSGAMYCSWISWRFTQKSLQKI